MSVCLEEGAVVLDKPFDFPVIEISPRSLQEGTQFTGATSCFEGCRAAEVPGHGELIEDEKGSTDQSPKAEIPARMNTFVTLDLAFGKS